MAPPSFKLSDQFIALYRDRVVPWGFRDAGGLALGEVTFLSKYSRLKADGTKETWTDVCRRVVEGTLTLQKRYCKANRLPWNSHKAQRTAQDMFDRMWTFKWTPPGRGLHAMGTPLVMDHGNAAPLQNCAFVSTANLDRRNPAEPFAFLMEASMLGIGVGFDTLGADLAVPVTAPAADAERFVIPDSREGWVESLSLLLNSYLTPGRRAVRFDYSEVRPKGTPIVTFGGTAAGPEPLEELHRDLRRILDAAVGGVLTAKLIVDIANMIGRCVVAGNVRRSAELALGRIEDPDFLDLKDPEAHPARQAWAWMSNNSVSVSVGDDLSAVLPGIVRNGEPGLVWLDVSRSHGRLADPPNHKDHRAAGMNPCAEQTLESYECCTLVETYLNRHDSLEDYLATLKVAYLYAKTVTLVPTHWERTNAVMIRNRRIGTSMSGVANFVDANGVNEFVRWSDRGYAEIQRLDRVYSEWLGVRESIKTTTIKPSGTVSLLTGESPGIHWSPGARFYYRLQRFAPDEPIVPLLEAAGYRVEPDVVDPRRVVVYFPIQSSALRSEREVSVWEKAHLAARAQRHWSDNSVSVTLSFTPEEEKDIPHLLRVYDGQLKSVSFLPLGTEGAYAQMPYQEIAQDVYTHWTEELYPVDLSSLYTAGDDVAAEAGCQNDVCLVRFDSNA